MGYKVSGWNNATESVWQETISADTLKFVGVFVLFYSGDELVVGINTKQLIRIERKE